MVEFECTSCGLCCKKIGLMLTLPPARPYLAKARAKFPYKAKKDGSCEKLDEDNKCTVYADRPLMCNISRLGDEPDMPMSKQAWFDLNYKGCELLQMELTA